MQKVTPFLWFDMVAEEAVEFYVLLFKNSRVLEKSYYPAGGPYEPGTVMMMKFELDGVLFLGLNGGPMYKLTEAFSMSVDCENQEEVDFLWDNLTANGGEESMCGWLTDRFGVTWQITPRQLIAGMTDPDPEKSSRVMQAMMTMRKIDIATIEAARRGEN